MPAIAVIPARYASTRFPGKVLYPLKGKPVLQHVYERAAKALSLSDTFIATDDERVRDVVTSFGCRVIMTAATHASGTDRIAEAVRILCEEGYPLAAGDFIVNVQGDEPLIRPEMIDQLVSLMEEGRCPIGTLARRISSPEEVFDPNIVKVVFTADGYALYFSRSPIPYHRDFFPPAKDRGATPDMSRVTLFKHIGMYGFTREGLALFTRLRPGRLEEAERLEQLRALENGMMIKVGETAFDTVGVDMPQDVARVEECLSTSS